MYAGMSLSVSVPHAHGSQRRRAQALIQHDAQVLAQQPGLRVFETRFGSERFCPRTSIFWWQLM
jgi:hypothetical protein